MPTSPLLAQASRASAHYDRSGAIKLTRPGGAWVSVIRCGNVVTRERHATQREAYEAIGLDGGSSDPYFVPAWDDNGLRTADL